MAVVVAWEFEIAKKTKTPEYRNIWFSKTSLAAKTPAFSMTLEEPWDVHKA